MMNLDFFSDVGWLRLCDWFSPNKVSFLQAKITT